MLFSFLQAHYCGVHRRFMHVLIVGNLQQLTYGKQIHNMTLSAKFLPSLHKLSQSKEFLKTSFTITLCAL